MMYNKSMKVYVLKKEKGKKYDSAAICRQALNFELEYDNKKPVGCSITDTKNYWAIAIGQCGLDIEEKGRKVLASITRSLHPAEAEYLSGLSFGSSEWNNEFFRIWTSKEAVYKLTGISFKQLSVLDENMNYKDCIDDFFIVHRSDKNLYLTLISDDDCIEIENIKYAGISAVSCNDYAAEMLAVKPYSTKELQKKLLAKGYSQTDVDQCIETFSELGYLNDADYAQRFSDNALAHGKGAAYIKRKLKECGIESYDMPEIKKESQFEAALEIANGMYTETENFEAKQKLLAKIARRLASRGFEAGTVYSVLDHLKR